MLTEWGEKLDAALPLNEYPRPQLVRNSWHNLNGCWDYAITEGDAPPETYDGIITVPFSPECELSGVKRMLLPHQTLWYRRSLPAFEAAGRVLLHFGAVDQTAGVYINGVLACEHTGGYTPFWVDITGLLTGCDELTVRVRDYTDTSYHSRGKQKTDRGNIWYTPQSGIWQTVWAECVPAEYISGLRITPLFDSSELELTVLSESNMPCTFNMGDTAFAFNTNTPTRIPAPDAQPWTPETPRLYDFSVTMGEDTVQSYFAMRSFGVGKDKKGRLRLLLNGKPYFHNGVLDQGYWPDGLYTAPSDEALIFDIQLMKDMGFNMLRKHIKLEPLRYYYHCDRLGMLVWQDMINGGGRYKPFVITSPLVTGVHFNDHNYARFAREDGCGRAQYYLELEELINTLYNCPCVAMWVLFNEGWGQFDAAEALHRTLALDGSRTVDHASGWHDQHIGDIKSLHVYFRPYHFRRDRARAVVLSEYGGYARRIEGHCESQKNYGYKRIKSEADMFGALSDLFDVQIRDAKRKGLAAAVYTQLSDVEDELNGLVTYDRRVTKLPVPAMRSLSDGLGAPENMRPPRLKGLGYLLSRDGGEE